jgi:SAM-dependent methyltransferase
MFNGHYKNWQNSRMNGIKKYFSPDFFKSKTLLELGCGYADIGNMFYELGANVTSSDARIEHLNIVQNKYPYIKTLLIDCDNQHVQDKYDIILNWGLLYHLKNIETHLKNISEKCDILLLETEVCDTNDKDYSILIDEEGYDQGINNKGLRVSPSYIEEILQKNGFKFKLIKDAILNSDFHIYDWEITNSKNWQYGLRRYWICWKNIDLKIQE